MTAVAVQPLTQPWTCERGFSSFFAVSWIKFLSKTSASFLNMPYTDNKNRKTFSVDCGSSYSVYIYFPSPNDPVYYPLVYYCTCSRPSLQIWCQLWCQPGFPISPKWGRHLLPTIRAPPDRPPPLICCSPGGWGVFSVQSYMGRIPFHWYHFFFIIVRTFF